MTADVMFQPVETTDEHAASPSGTSGAGGSARGTEIVAPAPLQADERDGLSERPPAALLLLVLGACRHRATCLRYWSYS